jgi:hypothetical protein
MYISKEVHDKVLAPVIVKAGNPKGCRVSQQVGDPGMQMVQF